MKKKKLLLLPVILVLLLLAVVCAEERKSYEILHSTVMSAPNLTEHKITVVIHTLLPVDREALVKEIVTNHQRLNGGRPNPYYELELYRTRLHYSRGIVYDTILCNGDGEIVTKIEL